MLLQHGYYWMVTTIASRRMVHWHFIYTPLPSHAHKYGTLKLFRVVSQFNQERDCILSISVLTNSQWNSTILKNHHLCGSIVLWPSKDSRTIGVEMVDKIDEKVGQISWPVYYLEVGGMCL